MGSLILDASAVRHELKNAIMRESKKSNSCRLISSRELHWIQNVKP